MSAQGMLPPGISVISDHMFGQKPNFSSSESGRIDHRQPNWTLRQNICFVSDIVSK